LGKIERVFGVGTHVRDLLDGAAENCPGAGRSPAERHREHAAHGLDSLSWQSMLGHEMEQ
jgi:hypothetical protein